MKNTAIIVVNLFKSNKTHNLEVPLDISANELCEALFDIYSPHSMYDMRQYYLKCEMPLSLLRGEKTLREYGIHDGSTINLDRF